MNYRSSIPRFSEDIRHSMARSLNLHRNEIGSPKNINQLIASYLEGRKKIGNEICTLKRPETGVPQGTVLSP